MSTLRPWLFALVLCGTLSGCGYAGVATYKDAAIVVKNDWFLFGALRKVYVCRITPHGLEQCSSAESP